MNNKIGKIILVLWLVLATGCFVFGGYQTIVSGFGKSYMFYILGIISIIMFYIRRTIMKKVSK